MNPEIIAAIAYGILALVGGIIGYVQAKSNVSLISGSISGIVLIAAGILQLQGVAWGNVLATVVTAVLVVVFVARFIKTRKVMPAALMVIAGAIALVIELLALFA
jgi:uncharacterized membrane protein (UPF0136 family)